MATMLKHILRDSNKMRYYSRWKLIDGSIIETDLTEKEYANLALKNAGEPDRKGIVSTDAKWLFSANMTVWDTIDGKLPFGGYDKTPSGEGVFLGIGELNPIIMDGTFPELLSADYEFKSEQGNLFKLKSGTLEKL